MIVDGDVVVEAFAAIGFTWGGHWERLLDYQHLNRPIRRSHGVAVVGARRDRPAIVALLAANEQIGQAAKS